MKKYSTTFGVDLGDKYSDVCELDSRGEIVEEVKLKTTAEGLRRRFESLPPCRIALEVGTHSGWVSSQLLGYGHEVLVGDARKLRAIYASNVKTDTLDARMLARLARFDPQLLSPIRHRSEEAQHDLALIRARDLLVRSRTAMINCVRGTVKSDGGRLPACSADSFGHKAPEYIPAGLRAALVPVVQEIERITQRIRAYDKKIAVLGETKYPQTQLLREIKGVGPLVALAFVLTLETAERFAKSRDVGPYLGLTPRKDQSGGHDPQL